jgi:iron(III) transport system substrate-binding protein
MKLEKPYRDGESLKKLQGMAAYFKVGTFSPRTDVPLPKGGENWPKVRKIFGSAEYQRDHVAEVNDFWVVETSN